MDSEVEMGGTKKNLENRDPSPKQASSQQTIVYGNFRLGQNSPDFRVERLENFSLL